MQVRSFADLEALIERTGFDEGYIISGLYLRMYLDAFMDAYLEAEIGEETKKRSREAKKKGNQIQKQIEKQIKIEDKRSMFKKKFEKKGMLSNSQLGVFSDIQKVENQIAHVQIGWLNNEIKQKEMKNEVESAYYLLKGLVGNMVKDKNEPVMMNVTKLFVGKTIRLKSCKTGNYVTAGTDQSSEKHVVARASAVIAQAWENFKVEYNKDCYDYVSLKTVSKNYLSANTNDQRGNAPLTNSKSSSEWEAFHIILRDGGYYLISLNNGKFVSVTEDESRLCACASKCDWWERFEIEIVEK